MRARKADSDAQTLTLGDHITPDAHPTAAMHHVRPLALPPMFCEGDVLAERFRIVRFLAHGGMGEVYEARDLELGTTVALKTIRRGVDEGEVALERFRREVLLARSVTHPNVCRIFDVFRHRFPTQEGGAADLLFLSMELLEGETLSERLRRAGRFEPVDALPVITQMAEALDAAHRAGVVHRDFKSNNVMLTAQEDGSLRAVVTDFGLAGRHHETDQPQDETGLTMGTPAYMAPEQVEGAEVTAAADIYGFGVVMYEMVTATVPFMALNPVATATLRLHTDPPSPRRHVPALDPRWEQVILRCLARRPEQRFASAGEAARALLPPALPFTVGRRSRRRLALELLLTVALLGTLTWALRLWMRPRAIGPLKSVQVTTSAGLDLFPALSPDGKRLIYASDRGGDFELYVRSTEPGGNDVAVTADGQQNFQPAWSPDGQLVAYHSQKRGGIWIIPLAGGSPRRLTDFGSRPSWSADGTQLAFQSEALVDLAANAVPAMPPSTLWVVAATGGKPRQVTSSGTPAGGHGGAQWSPDGRRLVFTASDRRASSVWSIGIDGRDLKMMSSVQVYGYDPIYSADAGRIYFSGLSQSGNYGLWSLDIDPANGSPRGEAQQIADLGMGSSRHLNMARDGSRIAFSALRMSSNLWRLPLLGGEPRPLTSETGRSARPVFAPDGQRLAFDRWQSGTNPDVWTIDADGRNARQLTRDSAVDTVPNWTPDGRAVVFVSARENKAAVWSHELASGQEAFLTLLGIDTDWARLSPDGRHLAYSRRGADGVVNVWRVALDSGQPRQITFDAEFAGFPCWSPDGRWLAVQLRRGQDSQIAVMPSEGGALDPLTSGPGQHWPYSFWPDGQSVAFAGQPGDLWNIYRIDRRTRREVTLTGNRKLNAYLRYPAVSPQGDALVYEYAETNGNIWLLEGLK